MNSESKNKIISDDGELTLTVKDVPIGLMERIVSLNAFFAFTEGKVKNPNVLFLDLTLDEMVVIFELVRKNGMYQNEIADRIHRNKSTVKRTIDKLEKKNAIIKVRDKEDSRKFNIFIKEDKMPIYKESLVSCAREDQRWVKEQLKDEYDDFMRMLRFLYEKNLEYYKS